MPPPPPPPPERRLSTVAAHVQAAPHAAMARRSPVTSHVLDTALGRPAAGMRVELQALAADGSWRPVGAGRTNADGRVDAPLVPADAAWAAGTYRAVFFTREYFEAAGVAEFFYPRVDVVFQVADPAQHFHVPLLVSPFGYSTYRGS